MKKHRTLEEQKAGRCVHFNGVQHKQCKAGVVYDSLSESATLALPCLRHLYNGRPPAKCDKLRWPTPEEVAKEMEQYRQSVEKFAKVMPLVGEIKKRHKGANWSGVEVCPACGGKLHLSHAAYNGHVWGKCETEGCVAWVE